jgi:hypothetical protein
MGIFGHDVRVVERRERIMLILSVVEVMTIIIGLIATG